jgi:2-oxoglutarate dehydrogenase E2 component (dihydrolipoamide succinyltransferase)
MPKMGESIIEATILKWVIPVGGTVEQDEPVLEIATDKVDSEVPAPIGGKLLEVLFKEGDVVPVGTVIAILETEAAAATSSAPANGGTQVAAPVTAAAAVVAAPVTAVTAAAPAAGPLANRSSNGRFYSPLVLNIARTEGVSMQELESLAGTGTDGRVTKKDILAYVKSPRTAAPVAPAMTQNGAAAKATPPADAKPAFVPAEGYLSVAKKSFSHGGNVEIVEMDRMRKMIAENMVYSKHVSAHVTSFVEADVTNIVLWRNKVKNEFEKKYGQKLTFTPIFVEAVAQALREHPMVNVSVDGDKIIVKKDINVGIAVALPTDNLIVPVIRNADRQNLVGLTTVVNDLAARARENKLKLDELEGGTYTLSNVGTFGNVMGTPVIMQPQVAIMAVGAIRKKPAVIETEMGDFIGVRQFMFLSHSYDHRVVDGALGGRFVRRVADLLENFDPNRPV